MVWLKRRKRGKRVVVIGLDCLAPTLAFDRFAEEMPHLSALRSQGASGLLESVIPPITVPAWACMTTGKHPGTLGIYGFRNRVDHSYGKLAITTSLDVQEKAIWDYLTDAGKRSIVVGVPPSFPPKPLLGHAVSCFLTPGGDVGTTYPATLQGELERRFGRYRFDVADFRTEDKAWLLDQIYQLSQQRFAVAKHLMTTKDWDFFMFVDMGPDRLHHGFWKFDDPAHIHHQPGNPFAEAMRDYYRFLDEQIGDFLACTPDDAQVLIVSDHGAKRMDGGICINEWLMREGYLTLVTQPDGIQRLEELEIDWSKSLAWGEGGYYSRIFLNVAGREPEGAVSPGEVEGVRDELIRKLEALGDEANNPIGTRVYRPEDLYPQQNRVPPDLIALFGDLHWRSVGTVGWGTTWVHENDTGPDDANHAQHGVIVAHNVPHLVGDLGRPRLMQVAGTVLQLMGERLPGGVADPI